MSAMVTSGPYRALTWFVSLAYPVLVGGWNARGAS